jgi:ubiquinone/menaquinone biosynthesis C-methylase UbiE
MSDSEPSPDFTVTVERFTGLADPYDAFRPRPPQILVEILTRLAQTNRPHLVVDLGCGTGLSTRFWAENAEKVVGVDPSVDMLRKAKGQTTAANISYRQGFSYDTGLPDHCADIVTCSQSLHWMEPTSTFKEASRILRSGGVFAAYDCDWPPTLGNWELEMAFKEFMAGVRKIEAEQGHATDLKRWPKSEHLTRMQASGFFRFTKEITVHSIESGNAERLVGLVLSLGVAANLLKHGMREEEIGLDRLRAVAKRTLGDQVQSWYFSYRVRLGIV